MKGENNKLTRERALKIIDRLANSIYRPPDVYKKKKEQFIVESYNNWAINEIAEWVSKLELFSPETVIEQFRFMMDRYCCKAKTDDQRIMFCSAYDVATHVLDIFIWEGPKK